MNYNFSNGRNRPRSGLLEQPLGVDLAVNMAKKLFNWITGVTIAYGLSWFQKTPGNSSERYTGQI
jgi:hypothetical protein